jgi:uncharacterized damage-inducible protein DinB
MPVTMPSRVLEIPRGWRSREAASFALQLQFLSARRFVDIASATPAELAWQPQRGANTIGMLLAHVEIVEVFWMLRATSGESPARLRRILGIAMEDDGIPIPRHGRPPASLRARPLAWYRRLHQRARGQTLRALRAISPAAMRRIVEVRPGDGRVIPVNVRWILFHLIEHEAAHYGQMMTLRHAYRDRRR